MIGIIWYRTKVLAVLKEKFGYKPAVPGWQAEVFNGVTKQVKKQGGNEYDGAIGFMLVQINSLQDETNPETTEWRDRMTQTAYALMPLGKLGSRVL